MAAQPQFSVKAAAAFFGVVVAIGFVAAMPASAGVVRATQAVWLALWLGVLGFGSLAMLRQMWRQRGHRHGLRRATRGGQLQFLPLSWRRWMLDE